MTDLRDATLTEHAVAQMAKRQIAEAEVRRVLSRPQKVVEVRRGRVVAQSVVGEHLVRVFVDVDRDPPEVVTVYRTSRIAKYGSAP